MTDQPFSSLFEVITALHGGRTVVVYGAAGSPEHGSLMLPAQYVTPEAINFMAKDGRGLICLALEPERCDELGLELMAAAKSGANSSAPFTVSVEAREGVTTGISAYDRARTIQVAADPSSTSEDLVRPGHVFPLRAREGGVLVYPGPAEAAVDLARLAGLHPAAVTCEVINDDGTVARMPDLILFCARHGLKLVRVDQIIDHRRRNERLVEREVEVKLPTAFGEFRAIGYRSLIGVGDHIVLVKGDPKQWVDPLVHVHQQCLTGDVLHSLSCQCRLRLESAMARIDAAGSGVLVYLAKADPFAISYRGPDHAIAAQILIDLGLSTIRSLSGDPEEARELAAHGVHVVTSPLEPEISPVRVGAPGALAIAPSQDALTVPIARSM